MSYTPHQLNLITKSILKLMPAVFLCSSSVAFATTITVPGELDDSAEFYDINTGTVLDINSPMSPTLNVNGSFIKNITNNGTVKNSVGGAININDMEGKLINNNVIEGNTYGIRIISSAQLEIINNEGATISGKENAIIGENNFALENHDLIKSENGDAILVKHDKASLQNDGKIISENGTGITVIDDASANISNAGTISGKDYAIKFESSEKNSLVLLSGSTLEGDVLSTNSKTNTLLLKDSGTEDSNFIGLNEGDGFASLNMAGEAWTLSGDIDLLGNDLDQKANDKALQVSSGILILTGKVNNAGGTTINNGATLQLGDATHTAAFTSDAVINNGTLVFNQSGDSTFSSDINGTGHVVKSDASTLTLNGTFSYTGGTELNGGTTLIAQDSLLGTTAAPATITINNSATLASNGSVTVQ